MGDEVKVAEQQEESVTQENNGDTDNQDQQQNITIDEFEKLKDQMKKFQKNFDRVNTEKQKLKKTIEEKEQIIDEYKKKNMSVEEFKKAKQEEYESKLKEKELSIRKMELDFHKTKMLTEKGFDSDLLEIVQGDDLDIFSMNIDKILDKINESVEKKVNERLTIANPKPQISQQKNTSVDGDYYSIEELERMNSSDIQKNLDKYRKSIIYYQQKDKEG